MWHARTSGVWDHWYHTDVSSLFPILKQQSGFITVWLIRFCFCLDLTSLKNAVWPTFLAVFDVVCSVLRSVLRPVKLCCVCRLDLISKTDTLLLQRLIEKFQKNYFSFKGQVGSYCQYTSVFLDTSTHSISFWPPPFPAHQSQFLSQIISSPMTLSCLLSVSASVSRLLSECLRTWSESTIKIVLVFMRFFCLLFIDH